jgi:hypothetical protein
MSAQDSGGEIPAAGEIAVPEPRHAELGRLPGKRKRHLTAPTPGFTGLIRYTLTGWIGALLLGLWLDHLGLQGNPWGQWAVRALSGQGEDLFEGAFALRQRLSGAAPSLAQSYGWGKLIGMVVPWIVDAGTRLAGVDTSGVAGFYIPWLYAMSDQAGASVSGFLLIRRQTPGLGATVRRYLSDPVMLASLIVIPIGGAVPLLARAAGFVPDTLVRTALETASANLCWIPPGIGWLTERRARRKVGGSETTTRDAA